MTFQLGADGRAVIFTRVISAPRELVFQAWTDPKHLSQWWGPRGMTNPVCEVDLRPGGSYQIVMRDPNGVDYPVRGTFLEIAAPERLVFSVAAVDHPAEWHEQLSQYHPQPAGEPALQQVWTVTCEEMPGGQTKLTVVNRFESADVLQAALKMGHAEGAGQSLDRLCELVERDTAAREIRLTRVFHASRELVFQAFTDPKHLAHWWGPDGFTLTTHEFDLRPGGGWRFTMHGPDGVDYRNEQTYVEIAAPERLVMDHGPSPVFRITVTLTELGAGKTELTYQMRFETAALRDQVVRVFGAEEGLKQTLGRLEEYLKTP